MKVKRAEIVVTANSFWGLERGTNVAVKAMEKGRDLGEEANPKLGIHVRWKSFDVNIATDVAAESILSDPQPIPEPDAYVAPQPQIPVAPSTTVMKVSTLDIEEARGVVGTAFSAEELDEIEDDETHSERFPGGRKGVLKYISQRRKEIIAIGAKRAAEAKAAAAADKLAQ